jgi:flavorubredoxin
MRMKTMKENVFFGGAVDWDRRLFDSLIPLPDGTSYNSYLVQGSDKTALIDTVDPAKADILFEQLSGVEKIDYLVAHHAEQDHAGCIPLVLAKYPEAKLLTSPKGKGLIIDHLHVDEKKITAVADGETVSLGDRTLTFIHTPWVHWPETMATYLAEEKILFTCDFFGSHLATTDMYARDEGRVYEAAKRYYAEIMMPFRHTIRSNLEKLKGLAIDVIAPSHGPAYDNPAFIMDAYRDWISDQPKNQVVVPYVSMHGSTRMLVERLVGSLAHKGITVFQFDLAAVDLGKLAISLVDAATIVIGTPTVHVGPHPAVLYAVTLANALRPKTLFASVVGSFGWAGKAAEQVAASIPNLKVEVLPPMMCKGMPRRADLEAVDKLGELIFEKHKARGLVK